MKGITMKYMKATFCTSIKAHVTTSSARVGPLTSGGRGTDALGGPPATRGGAAAASGPSASHNKAELVALVASWAGAWWCGVAGRPPLVLVQAAGTCWG